jgi:hypothetical protein
MAYVSDKTLYHDGNGNVFEAAGKGRELLVRKGGELSTADAARFRLIEPPKRKAAKVAPAPDAVAAPAAPQKEG